MIGSISRGYTNLAAGNLTLSATRPAVSTGSMNFSLALSAATAKVAEADGDTASISDAARAKASSYGSDGLEGFDFNYSNVDHTQNEYNAYIAKFAHQISESQGLPDGKYDLSNISPKQLHVIMNDLIVNKGVNPLDLAGITEAASTRPSSAGGIGPDQGPFDLTDVLRQQIDYYDGTFDSTNERVFQNSLDVALSITRDSTKSTATSDVSVQSFTKILSAAAARQGQ